MSDKPGFRLKNVLVLEERSSSLNEMSIHRDGGMGLNSIAERDTKKKLVEKR